MASNPLPPAKRYPGSVGIAAGPEFAIMDEDGNLLAPGELGEIVIRGRNVTAGYENNPDANAKAFTNGWFRTGDQGIIDEDGYLRLTGRLKELINRGGEKISPLEVDVVLMDHPAVAQVRDLRDAASRCWARKWPPPSCCARVSRPRRARTARLRRGSPRAVQGAAQDRLPDRNPQGRDRQAAAHRPGGETRPDGIRRRMKIAIFGAGAIGGFLGVKLPPAGADVTFIARGPHLAAMQANGVTLISGGETITVHPRCVADAARGRACRTTSSSR